ncbi:MAG: rod shape-determining protein MreC [Patescibacteria group bacterium]|nr:rod shape-determining protein MreC [Patescibacteria group bacterium]
MWQFFLAISFVLVLFDWLGLSQQLKNQLEPQARRLLQLNVNIGGQVVSSFSLINKMHHSARRIQDLERKLTEAEANLSELGRLQKENQELRQLIENNDRKLAETKISRPVLSFAQPAIALGSESGLNKGSAVLVAQTLVGTISKVEENLAYVNLLWQSETNPILAKTESGVEGLVVGKSRRVILSQVPLEADIKVGERVVTVGQKGISPDIYIGNIRSVETGPCAAVKQAVIEQYVSFYEAKLVEVR